MEIMEINISFHLNINQKTINTTFIQSSPIYTKGMNASKDDFSGSTPKDKYIINKKIETIILIVNIIFFKAFTLFFITHPK